MIQPRPVLDQQSESKGGGGAAGEAPPSVVPANVTRVTEGSFGTLQQLPESKTQIDGNVGSVQQAYSLQPDPTVPYVNMTVKLFIQWTPTDKRTCSGTLIGRKTVLTSAHCLSTEFNVQATSLLAVPGLDGTYMPYGAANAATWFVSNDYVSGPVEERYNYDYALVILDRDIGNLTGWRGFGAYTDSQLDGAYVGVWGYPGNFWQGVKMGATLGNVMCDFDLMLYDDLETDGGLSGGGLVMLAPQPQYYQKVAGIHKGDGWHFFCDPGELHTRAIRITNIKFDNILDVLDWDGTPTKPWDQWYWSNHGTFTNAPVTMAALGTNKLDVYTRGSDFRPIMQRLTPSGWLPSVAGWTFISRPGVVQEQTIGTIAAVSRAADQVDLFMRSKDTYGTVCTKARYLESWWPGEQTWSCFGDFTSTVPPTAVSRQANDLAVFAVDSAGVPRWKSWSQITGWGSAFSLGTTSNGAFTRNQVAAAVRPGSSGSIVDVFLRHATSNQICHKSIQGSPTNGAWNCQAPPNGPGGTNIVGSPVVVNRGANKIDVFAIVSSDDPSKNPVGRVATWSWTPNVWVGPTYLSPAGGAPYFTSVAAVSRSANLIDLVARADTGEIWTRAFNGTSWVPTGNPGWWNLQGDGLDASVSSFGPFRLDVMTRGADNGAVRYRYWDGAWH